MAFIRLGPSGTSGLGYAEGIVKAAKLGFSALEIAFTHGVAMKNPSAASAQEIASENGVQLSIHAPYYINLATDEKTKLSASMDRILQSAERAHHMNASCVVFHPGYYMKLSAEKTYDRISSAVGSMMDTMKDRGFNTALAPETSGKKSQFGSPEEIVQLMHDTGCASCFDFAHIYARDNGFIDYKEVFALFRKSKHQHCHFSGIEFTDKGERKHLDLTEDFFKPLAHTVISTRQPVTIISESPVPSDGALVMQKTFRNLDKDSLV